MSEIASGIQKPLPKWENILFLALTPIGAVALLPILFYFNTTTWWLVALYMGYGAVTSLSITAGYHRLFAHRTYESNQAVKFLFLLFGSAAFQGSALQWATDHRRHHAFVDTDKDPHNILQGFWHAHVGWLLNHDKPQYLNNFVLDHSKDPLFQWQHKYYVPIAFLMGFGFPMFVGWLLGDPTGGLIVGGFWRIVITQHSTFFVNSLAHYWGVKTYDLTQTARDNFFLAFFTYGEGFHNFHHTFANDFRNGVKWYHWDPSKWLILALAGIGCANRLKRTCASTILEARVRADEEVLLKYGFSPEYVAKMKKRLLDSQLRWRNLIADYKKLRETMQVQSSERLAHMKIELKYAKQDFKIAFHQWVHYRRQKKVGQVYYA